MSLNQLVDSQHASFDNAKFNNLIIDGNIYSDYFFAEDGFMLQINSEGLAVFAPPPTYNSLKFFCFTVNPITLTTTPQNLSFTNLYSNGSFGTLGASSFTFSTAGYYLVVQKYAPFSMLLGTNSNTNIIAYDGVSSIDISNIAMTPQQSNFSNKIYGGSFIHDFGIGDVLTFSGTTESSSTPFTGSSIINNIVILQLQY